jgi:hypothetical protein
LKKLFIFLLIGISLFGAARVYYALTDDFQIRNITYSIAARQEWEFPATAAEKLELKRIMGQKFYYLGKGAQVYAFGSEDGLYVIKFFKFKHLKPSLFIELLPPIGPLKKFKEQSIQRKTRKREGVFSGHAIAYKYDKDNSGLLYLHFNLTHDLCLKAQVMDKLGRSHEVDLDSTIFVVQKKGITLRAALQEELEKGRVEAAAKKGAKILQMYVEEYRKGVFDRDHGITHNTGFIGDTPFHLDVGKFSRPTPPPSQDFFREDLAHVAFKIKQWVKNNYPEYSAEFDFLLNEHKVRLFEGPSDACAFVPVPACVPVLELASYYP